MLNFCNVDAKILSAIADQNPLKQGKYTAGTHIPINSPKIAIQKDPDYVFITAWNFADEIIENLKNKYNFKGKYITPLPDKPSIKDN